MNLQQRAAGILLHLTSLPGPHGIGDFGPGAYHFVDWLQSCGQRVWQMLPTNPIGPGDSPYQSVSAFAGSPLMVALEPLVDKGWLKPPELPEGGFDPGRVDYGRVIPWRMQQLRDAADGFFARGTDAEQADFQAYCTQQAHWLDTYALFMALELASGWKPWWEWDAGLAAREPQALQDAGRRHAQDIRFWQFVQWCFDTQGAALKAYANARGISLMGDLPIFIAHHSADCWSRPELYLLDDAFQPTVVAGVPPDGFAATGQRWGNPLYRWDKMAEEGYAWWIARIRRALTQADVFRIDHFRGFAGYYEIPSSHPTAEHGRWVPGPGRPLFDAIAAALGDVPIVAEDLGLITPDVVALRDAFGFPGMKIIQFAFGGDASDTFLPHNHGRNFIAYTGTHDNDTAVGWWDTCSPRERAYAGTYLGCGRDGVHWAMIRAAWNSVCNVAVAQFQDVLGLDGGHRMNLPGSVGPKNWSWRFTWDMVGDEPGRVLGMLTAASGRGPFELLRLP